MDLRFTDEEIAFRKEVRDFIARELPKETHARMLSGRSPTKQQVVDWQRKLNAKGWAVPEWPVDWGGPGWTLGQERIEADRHRGGELLARADGDGLARGQLHPEAHHGLVDRADVLDIE
jgi:alkylation response protein AidB-like acyl-CoA dehydrogenase